MKSKYDVLFIFNKILFYHYIFDIIVLLFQLDLYNHVFLNYKMHRWDKKKPR